MNNSKELKISLCGRLTAENTPETQEKIMASMTEERPSKITIDAAKLEYISSSGLRLLLSLKKQCPDLQIINV